MGSRVGLTRDPQTVELRANRGVTIKSNPRRKVKPRCQAERQDECEGGSQAPALAGWSLRMGRYKASSPGPGCRRAVCSGGGCGSDTKAGNGGAACGSAPGPQPPACGSEMQPRGCRPVPPLLPSGHTPLLELRCYYSLFILNDKSRRLWSAHPAGAWHLEEGTLFLARLVEGPRERTRWRDRGSRPFRWHLSLCAPGVCQ